MTIEDPQLKIGDVVEYLGCSKEQIAWGNNDEPSLCSIGKKYSVIKVDIHRYHTKIELEGIPGRFNSVCFSKVTS